MASTTRLPGMQKSVRVLHVVSRMNRGGIETWLMHLLRNIDRSRFQMDFLVNDDSECHYSSEIRELGSSTVVCPPSHSRTRLTRQLATALEGQAPYDIIHAHKQHYNGEILRAAATLGIPGRIAHSHSTTAGRKPSFLRSVYYRYMQQLISRYSTHGFACSPEAAEALFGYRWKSDSRWSVLECSVDLSGFSNVTANTDLRNRMGFDQSDFIVGHVGRLDPAKNHEFLLNTFSELKSRLPCAKLVLVGHGELEGEIRTSITRLCLEGSVLMTGSRADVPELLVNLFDVFVLPSRYEGLPLSVVEAQAAGLHCLVSDRVTRAVSVNDAQLDFLPINSTQLWARRLSDLYRSRQRLPLNTALASIAQSPFSPEKCLDRLCREYVAAISGRLRESA